MLPLISYFILFLTTIAIPVFAMRMLAKELELVAPRQKNYRGIEVWHGLGVVWAIWILGAWIGGIIIGAIAGYQPSWLIMVNAALPLVMGACLFGMYDDWIGSSSDAKGFSGHFSKLLDFRISTGALKFMGIGLVTIFTAASITDPLDANITTVVEIVLKACVIALSANLINLLDLRPARALKSYTVGVLVACLMLIIFMGKIWTTYSYFALVFASLGPVFASWKYDAGELGIMGDAGANAMGAYMGFLFASALPISGLVLIFALLLALNVLSEFKSFSQIIEGSKILSFIDKLGRNA